MYFLYKKQGAVKKKENKPIFTNLMEENYKVTSS
jgi:hypothetical protein